MATLRASCFCPGNPTHSRPGCSREACGTKCRRRPDSGVISPFTRPGSYYEHSLPVQTYARSVGLDRPRPKNSQANSRPSLRNRLRRLRCRRTNPRPRCPLARPDESPRAFHANMPVLQPSRRNEIRRFQRASSGSGKSVRRWTPRVSSRVSAASIIILATVSMFCNSQPLVSLNCRAST